MSDGWARLHATEAHFQRWRLDLSAGTKQRQTRGQACRRPDPRKPSRAKRQPSCCQPHPLHDDGEDNGGIQRKLYLLFCLHRSHTLLDAPLEKTLRATQTGSFSIAHISTTSQTQPFSQVLICTPTPSKGLKAVGFSSLVLKTGGSCPALPLHLLGPGDQNTACDSKMHHGC